MKEDDLGRYSPGRLLISFLIRWSISKKIGIFDFALGDEDYKKSWSNTTCNLFSYVKLISFYAIILYILIKIRLILKSSNKNNFLLKILLSYKKHIIK